MTIETDHEIDITKGNSTAQGISIGRLHSKEIVIIQALVFVKFTVLSLLFAACRYFFVNFDS